MPTDVIDQYNPTNLKGTLRLGFYWGCSWQKSRSLLWRVESTPATVIDQPLLSVDGGLEKGRQSTSEASLLICGASLGFFCHVNNAYRLCVAVVV